MYKKYKSLVSNTAIFAIGNILVKLISFILMPLYTSVLTTEQYAVSELLNSLIEIVLPIMTLCSIEALYRFSIDENADYKAIYMNTFYTVIVGIVIVVSVCFCVQKIGGYPYAMAFARLYTMVVFYNLSTQFARGLGYSKIFVLSGIINSIALVVANVYLLVIRSGGVMEYLNSFAIAYMVAGVFAFVAAKEYRFFSIGYRDFLLYKSMICYSIPSVPNMLAWWINSISSRYIIMFFWGNSLAGMYTAASKLPAIVNLVSSVFQQAWQYSTAREITDKDKDDFFSDVFKFYSAVCYVCCSILIIMTPFIAKLLFQKEFYVAWKYVPFLLVAATIGCFSTFYGTFFNAVKKNVVLMTSTILGAVINLCFNVMLVPKYGIMAASIVSMVSYLVVTAIRIVCVRKYVIIKTDLAKNLISVVLLIVQASLMSFGDSAYALGAYFVFGIILIMYYDILRNIVVKVFNVIFFKRIRREEN